MSTPVVHLFQLGVDERNRDSFYQVGVKNFQTSYEEEAGTLAMYASSLKENPLEYKVFEVYADEVAYQSHRTSLHYQSYVEQVGSKLTKREVYEVEALFLEEKLPSGVWLGAEKYFLKFAQIQVEAGSEKAFERSVLLNMQTSIKEEVGVLAMYAVKDSQQSNRYYFYEVYASAKAYEDHRLTLHFQRYISETQDLVEEKILQDLENSIAISKGQLAFSS
ncbi:TPA: antibiotic biosynthesis monooxygenase [Streptococcus suis]|uniref:putative quinol monooxygenase n=1 Tax=Streptococcus suis TaxID=1307 RepID=UPI001ABE297B|nr:antibiotic biosynthesis monooxygenase [Streptococcus suis]MBO4109279.1 antibiotic biosynthesis monooxygenase [Streptococcus suis]HEM3635748.1 antibiotic biosynthesis monooxygenase [Streptococcus suis]HEM3667830.1 antibiotic biosynthesis monooxygenase [Streptococcus suis]HEM3721894.1 antibiotic biosynthesis monooxygenase [Streptococcus suis]